MARALILKGATLIRQEATSVARMPRVAEPSPDTTSTGISVPVMSGLGYAQGYLGNESSCPMLD